MWKDKSKRKLKTQQFKTKGKDEVGAEFKRDEEVPLQPRTTTKKLVAVDLHVAVTKVGTLVVKSRHFTRIIYIITQLQPADVWNLLLSIDALPIIGLWLRSKMGPYLFLPRLTPQQTIKVYKSILLTFPAFSIKKKATLSWPKDLVPPPDRDKRVGTVHNHVDSANAAEPLDLDWESKLFYEFPDLRKEIKGEIRQQKVVKVPVGLLPINQNKNRDTKLFAVDSSRVYVTVTGEEGAEVMTEKVGIGDGDGESPEKAEENDDVFIELKARRGGVRGRGRLKTTDPDGAAEVALQDLFNYSDSIKEGEGDKDGDKNEAGSKEVEKRRNLKRELATGGSSLSPVPSINDEKRDSHRSNDGDSGSDSTEGKHKSNDRNKLSDTGSRTVVKYINANWIDGARGQKYICTQAPLPNTVVDFWLMVWQHNIEIVVMLTCLEEKNKTLADKYWPSRVLTISSPTSVQSDNEIDNDSEATDLDKNGKEKEKKDSEKKDKEKDDKKKDEKDDKKDDKKKDKKDKKEGKNQKEKDKKKEKEDRKKGKEEKKKEEREKEEKKKKEEKEEKEKEERKKKEEKEEKDKKKKEEKEKGKKKGIVQSVDSGVPAAPPESPSLEPEPKIEEPFLEYPHPVFGVDPKTLVTPEEPVHYFFQACISFLMTPEALNTIGLFRVPGSQDMIQIYKDAFNSGSHFTFPENTDPHDVAGLFKQYLRELPSPLIPNMYNSQIPILLEQYSNDQQMLRLGLSEVIKRLPTGNSQLYFTIILVLAKIAENADVNMMNVENLLKCIVPTLRCTPVLFNHFLTNPFESHHFDIFYESVAARTKYVQDAKTERAAAAATIEVESASTAAAEAEKAAAAVVTSGVASNETESPPTAAEEDESEEEDAVKVNYIISQFALTNKATSESRVIYHYQYVDGWDEDNSGIPLNLTSWLEFTSDVFFHKYKRLTRGPKRAVLKPAAIANSEAPNSKLDPVSSPSSSPPPLGCVSGTEFVPSTSSPTSASSMPVSSPAMSSPRRNLPPAWYDWDANDNEAPTFPEMPQVQLPQLPQPHASLPTLPSQLPTSSTQLPGFDSSQLPPPPPQPKLPQIPQIPHLPKVQMSSQQQPDNPDQLLPSLPKLPQPSIQQRQKLHNNQHEVSPEPSQELTKPQVVLPQLPAPGGRPRAAVVSRSPPMMQRMEDRKQKLDVEIEAHSRSQSERIEQKRTEKEEEVEIEQEEFTFQDMLAALPNALAMNLVVHDSLGLERCFSFLLADILVKSALLMQRLPTAQIPLPTSLKRRVIDEGGEGNVTEPADDGDDGENSARPRALARRRGHPLQVKLSPPTQQKSASASLKVRKFAKDICMQRSIDMLSSPEHYEFIGRCVRLMIEGDDSDPVALPGTVSQKRKRTGKSKYPHVNKGATFYRTKTTFS